MSEDESMRINAKALLSAIIDKLKKDAAALLLLLTILASILGVGVKVGSIIDTLAQHEKQINSLIDAHAQDSAKIDSIMRTTDILCFQLRCYPSQQYHEKQPNDPGSAKNVEPRPDSQLAPPPTIADKKIPPPISTIDRTRW